MSYPCPTYDIKCPYYYQGLCNMSNPEGECEDYDNWLMEGEKENDED